MGRIVGNAMVGLMGYGRGNELKMVGGKKHRYFLNNKDYEEYKNIIYFSKIKKYGL